MSANGKVLIGTGGHSLSVIDVIECQATYEIVGLLVSARSSGLIMPCSSGYSIGL